MLISDLEARMLDNLDSLEMMNLMYIAMVINTSFIAYNFVQFKPLILL